MYPVYPDPPYLVKNQPNPWYPLEPHGNATSQVVAIHGGLDQEERHEAIRSFKEGSKVQLVVEIFSPKKNQPKR